MKNHGTPRSGAFRSSNAHVSIQTAAAAAADFTGRSSGRACPAARPALKELISSRMQTVLRPAAANREKSPGGRLQTLTESDAARLISEASRRNPRTLDADAHLWDETLLMLLAGEHLGTPVSVKTLQRRLDELFLRPALPHQKFLEMLLGSKAHAALIDSRKTSLRLRGRLFYVFRFKLVNRRGRLCHLNDLVRSPDIAPETARHVFYAYAIVSAGGRQRYYCFSREGDEKARVRNLMQALLRTCPTADHIHLLPVVTKGLLSESATLDRTALKDIWNLAAGRTKQCLHVHPVRVPSNHATLAVSDLRYAVSEDTF